MAHHVALSVIISGLLTLHLDEISITVSEHGAQFTSDSASKANIAQLSWNCSVHKFLNRHRWLRSATRE